MHENEVGFKNELYKKQYNIEHSQLAIGMVDHADQKGKQSEGVDVRTYNPRVHVNNAMQYMVCCYCIIM